MRKTTTVNGVPVYVSATGLVRLGGKGKAEQAGKVYGMLNKGEARRLRKALNAAGYAGIAGAKRAAR